MEWTSRRTLMLLNVFLSLPILGQTCFSRSSTISTPNCDTLQLTHICHVTTYNNNDVLLSTDTVWTCTDDGYTSLHPSPDCCSLNHIETGKFGINLTNHVTTNIDCTLVSIKPSFEYEYNWTIAAPPGSQVLLTVPSYDVHNMLRATDEIESNNTYVFSVNSFVTDGDSFISSYHAVNMDARVSDSAPSQDIIFNVRAILVKNAVNMAVSYQECTIPSISGGNRWDNESVCGYELYTFEDSCYQFSTNHWILPTAKRDCETISGYHLVYIESREEQAFLAFTAASITPLRNYWIGIEKNGDGEQVWMDGSAITYSNFDDINNGGNCFQMSRRMNYIWNDRGCPNRGGSICERERGYHGSNTSHVGCIAFKGTIPANIDNEGAILLKFSYTIKTYLGTDKEESTTTWKGNYISECLPTNDQSFSQKGLQVNVSCSDSFSESGVSLINFQARGVGLVQISNVQLVIHRQVASTDGTSSPTTKYEMSQDENLSTGTKNTIIAIVVVFFIVILITGITAVIWYKRRGKSPASEREARSKSIDGSVKNPTFQNDSCEEHEYADLDSSRKSPSATVNGTSEDVQQHAYSELRNHIASISHTTEGNESIYNEVKQDCSTLFGTKEQDDYHEYNLPEGEERRSKANDQRPTTNNTYQELLTDRKIGPPNGTLVSEARHVEQEAVVRQQNAGGPSDSEDRAYQQLRKDNDTYTSLHHNARLPGKGLTNATAQAMENTYQALHADVLTDASQACQEPDSRARDQDNSYQSLRKYDCNSEYAVLKSAQEDYVNYSNA